MKNRILQWTFGGKLNSVNSQFEQPLIVNVLCDINDIIIREEIPIISESQAHIDDGAFQGFKKIARKLLNKAQ